MEDGKYRIDAKITTFFLFIDVIIIEYLSKWAELRGVCRSGLELAIIFYNRSYVGSCTHMSISQTEHNAQLGQLCHA